jgi:hypothetical protein
MSVELSSLARRQFLGRITSGVAGIALADLIGGRLVAADGSSPALKELHYSPRAKQVLQIVCPGAASHLDLWDYKPELEKRDGQPLAGEESFVSFQGPNGPLMRSPWAFTPAGKSGKMISSMLPGMARHVDDIAFIHSMTSRTNTHGPGCVYMNTCFTREGFPTAGAWMSYGLGSLNDNLPTYVAIQDVRGEPPNGKANWSNGFLPAQHQGIPLAVQQPLRNLKTPPSIGADEEAATRDLLRRMNERHAAEHPEESELRGRIAAYELAAKMQLAAPEVADLSEESESTHAGYGTADANPLKVAYAKNCLLARRLIEKGVRYVSLYCASRASAVDGLLNWDAHRTLKGDYERHCPVFDQPTAMLLDDLKQRGLLSDVLVMWTTEFGRMPTRQATSQGRDHNPDAFTCWLMGAGIKGGVSYGATDEFGRRSVENIATAYDFYATVLRILGIDHEKLTYYHNGTNRRLTDVHGHVIDAVLT